MVKNMVKYALVVCGVFAAAQAQANFPTVPKETYEALKIERSASPKELYEALLKRYMDPNQNGQGNMSNQNDNEQRGKEVLAVHGFLDHPKAEKAGVEIGVALWIARDGGDVVDALELHLERPPWLQVREFDCFCNYYTR